MMKKLGFLGDSITEGCGVTLEDRYATVLSKMLGVQEVNDGIGGTRIASQTIPTPEPSAHFDLDFVGRVAKLEKDLDLLIVFGGTNDYGHGDAIIGNENDTSVYTFYGAVKELIRLLIEKYGKEKLLFILPLPRAGQDVSPKPQGGEPLKVYIDILEKKYQENNLRYIDFSKMFPIEKINDLTVDGLHPNAKGHLLLANYLAKYIKDNNLL